MVSVQVSVRIPRVLQRGALERAWDTFVRRARVIISQDEAERFETSTAPDGQPWQPLKRATRQRAVLNAIAKVGGRAARPLIVRTPTGGYKVIARRPQSGYQRTAVVRRTQLSKILVDTGRLRASVVAVAASADAVRRQGRYWIEWGTRTPYARAHQYGDPARNLPARPYLGVSRAAQARLEHALARAVQSI